MHQAKVFLIVCLGILALATAFHLGAKAAQGQATNPIVETFTDGQFGQEVVLTENGDLWLVVWDSPTAAHGVKAGNVFRLSSPFPATSSGTAGPPRARASRR